MPPDAVAAVREYILANPDVQNNMSRYVEGWGWDHTAWKQWPTAVCILHISGALVS
jgi:hypothetical protein